jgi:hypothetical protein
MPFYPPGRVLQMVASLAILPVPPPLLFSRPHSPGSQDHGKLDVRLPRLRGLPLLRARARRAHHGTRPRRAHTRGGGELPPFLPLCRTSPAKHPNPGPTPPMLASSPVLASNVTIPHIIPLPPPPGASAPTELPLTTSTPQNASHTSPDPFPPSRGPLPRACRLYQSPLVSSPQPPERRSQRSGRDHSSPTLG